MTPELFSCNRGVIVVGYRQCPVNSDAILKNRRVTGHCQSDYILVILLVTQCARHMIPRDSDVPIFLR